MKVEELLVVVVIVGGRVDNRLMWCGMLEIGTVHGFQKRDRANTRSGTSGGAL
jgi:hypothetical protein